MLYRVSDQMQPEFSDEDSLENRLANSADLNSKVIYVISPPMRRLGNHRIAREVSSLSWSSDGKVLAIGRKGGRSGGFALHSCFGRPLTDSSIEPDHAYSIISLL